MSPPDDDEARRAYERRHLLLGWWSVGVFALVGLGLEALHGFKASSYLGVGSETRRLLWTLGHAHGTLLGLVNIGFAASLSRIHVWRARDAAVASGCFVAATLLLPAGFFLGGTFHEVGDPGLGVVLVPVGAVFLVTGALCVARAVSRRQ